MSKTKRNNGKEYVSRDTGNLVRARKVGPPCNDGYYDKIGMDVIKVIHKMFWDMGDYAMQNAYIQKFVVKKAVGRRRVVVTQDKPAKHSCTRAYSFLHDGKKYSVCAVGFGNILGISARCAEVAVSAVSATGVPREDRRGQNTPKHAMDDRRKQLVVQHVKCFPSVSSHYTRAKSPLMRYLDTNLNVRKMYRLYREWLDQVDENEEPVKLSYYRKVLRGFRLGFKPPSTDTCSQCDHIEVSKKKAKDEEERTRIQKEWEEHMELARKGLATLSHLKDDNDPQVRCICLHLQQTLPVPCLSTSVAYYKRKLWLYNLCIHDLKTNESKFYLWDEMNGG